MRALRRFTVRVSLPAELSGLGELVMNLRWSWHPPTRDLFEQVDPDLWRSCEGDPLQLLGAVAPERLAALAADKRFARRLQDGVEDLREYLTSEQWYQSRLAAGAALPRSIAYFSPEFGITEALPQYSGGLGILAGDHLKAASDLGVPIVGVGLLYRSGYFSQSLSADGWQQERYPSLDPHGMPLVLLQDGDAPVLVGIDLPGGRVLHAQVWLAQVGRVPLLLLDSDVEQNAPTERAITDRLYGGGAEHRLAQETLLGVGGVRALRAYSALTGMPEPEVFHTNEGHAGFLGLERIRELMTSRSLTFPEALQAVRAGTVFTTHTPVAAGIDRFGADLVGHYLGGGPALPGVPLDDVLALGEEDEPGVFNMARMGLRLAQRANGVSRLHGRVSREMFRTLWTGFDADEVPIGSVTNGVHAPTWVDREILERLEPDAGAGALIDGEGFGSLGRMPAGQLWELRRVLRARLVTEIRHRVRASAVQRGMSEAELGWTDTIFDPDVLTIGFARRVPSYKRLTLMLRDADRLRRLLLDPDRPIQVVVAGKSHPADDGGKQLIAALVRFADDPEIRHRIAFLPDYDIGMARQLYAGCDVWLNNPLRPLEACGTSGMKAALNGGLNLSIRDGWWDEMYDGQNGWSIPTADGVDDPDRRDDLEAGALYELLEKEVAARFYDRDRSGVPQRWMRLVRHTLTTLGPKVLATRMVRDYVEGFYAPAAAASAALAGTAYAAARDYAVWQDRVRAAWPNVGVEHVESSGVGEAPELGSTLRLRAEVVLAGLSPEDVVVQAASGRVDERDDLCDVSLVEMSPVDDAGASGTRQLYVGKIPLNRTGAFGYTVRVLPRHDLMATPAELGLVTSA